MITRSACPWPASGGGPANRYISRPPVDSAEPNYYVQRFAEQRWGFSQTAVAFDLEKLLSMVRRKFEDG